MVFRQFSRESPGFVSRGSSVRVSITVSRKRPRFPAFCGAWAGSEAFYCRRLPNAGPAQNPEVVFPGRTAYNVCSDPSAPSKPGALSQSNETRTPNVNARMKSGRRPSKRSRNAKLASSCRQCPLPIRSNSLRIPILLLTESSSKPCPTAGLFVGKRAGIARAATSRRRACLSSREFCILPSRRSFANPGTCPAGTVVRQFSRPSRSRQ